MVVDRETGLNYCSITMEDRQRLLDAMRKVHRENMGEEESRVNPQLWFNSDLGNFECEEYYFDETQNSIEYSGISRTGDGSVSISVSIPLSDSILIDILQHSIKRLNKLKTALETLR